MPHPAAGPDSDTPASGTAPTAHAGSDHPPPPTVADVAALRRRTGELAALYASARELAAMRDADAVLERLVDRAHELLAADVAYLSEFDETDETLRVRATRGTVTAALRGLVVPPGRGLVGAIAESRMPHAVRRYDAVDADRHTTGVDAAVAGEGIVSMLGVPLLSEDRVLGVLFVAERREREFGPDDTALLAALADHASVVLQTAAALADARRQAERARAAAAELTAHVAARDRANRVHRELVDAVLAGGGLAPVATALSAALRAPVAILDASGAVRAMHGATSDALVDAARSGDDTDAGVSVVSPIAAGGRGLGVVVVGPSARELDDVDRRTIERAGQVAALLALSEEAVAEADHRQRSDLLIDLVTASAQRRADVAAALRRSGVDAQALGAVTALAVTGERRAAAARALAHHLGQTALVGELDGLVVAAHAAPVDAASFRQLRDAMDLDVLAVTTVAAPDGIAAAARDVRAAVALARALGLRNALVGVDDLLPYAAAIGADRRALDAFLDSALGAVRRHDGARGSELLATLRAFVHHGASPTRTARALTFHTNTILQRLEKLDALLGEGWRDGERFFRLSIAVRLDDLRERLERDGDG
ncbi:PucR C-terminal helix-turn-helix domain-containing protein [Microbacterium sp. ru370.1]|uniref:helix-turn-helix domain-containing protein n=1 Tax=unclassified Microbacterium TaxID=2609290 RepID=UPI000884D137|nr:MULTISPECIES: GAF domain-containing protein [unclassified Microbacterium]SDO25662.1 PucR C-terminal helix-turn-helix domain-containing protein [Microbacterium sp. ru370.1]SIT73831.1 PucR C-terminal helix-turn-helix domain-containing protein [Microbacterium sp. RU1D]